MGSVTGFTESCERPRKGWASGRVVGRSRRRVLKVEVLGLQSRTPRDHTQPHLADQQPRTRAYGMKNGFIDSFADFFVPKNVIDEITAPFESK